MRKINVQLENCKLADLGIDQTPTYTELRFNEAHFVGYWLSIENEDIITFYLGPQSFICKKSQKNIQLFESILNEGSSHNNNV